MINDIVTFQNITKTFAGIKALEEVTFSIKNNEIHGIVGENGAGKSTLLKIIAGDISSYAGNLLISERIVQFRNPHEAILAGVRVVYQELNLCPDLNTVQNIFLGREIRKGMKVDWKRMGEISAECLDKLKLDIDLIKPVKYLSAAQRQQVEIVKAVVTKSRIIIMDEPTASLNELEVDRLFTIIRGLKDEGVTVLFVSHRLKEVLLISDRISVMRNGRYVDTVQTKETNETALVKLIIGELKLHDKRELRKKCKTEIMNVKALEKRGSFKNINFSLQKGEVLGIFGLEGSGRFDLGRSLFGIMRYSKGKIQINGVERRVRKPFDAIRIKMGFISRDRKEEGILPKMDLVANVTIVESLKDKLIQMGRYSKITSSFVKKLHIRCNNIIESINALSGGNQQKCIVSRWLTKKQDIIIMEEPTHGIDVGAKAEMFTIMKEMASSGTSIILISSESNEMINECDRILIMRNGEIKGEVMSAETSETEIMRIAAGVSSNMV